MGDLARRRAALDLRISRGHLRAAAAGVVLVSTISFGLGVLVGRDVVPAEPDPTGGLLSPVADGEVVELLARVEAAAAADGRAELTFPDALRGAERAAQAAGAGPSAPAPPVEVEAAPATLPTVEVDAVPAGAWTIEVLRTADAAEAEALRDHLRAREVGAWLDAGLVDGQLEYRVAVDGFRTEEGAIEAMVGVEAALDDAPGGSEPSVQSL